MKTKEWRNHDKKIQNIEGIALVIYSLSPDSNSFEFVLCTAAAGNFTEEI